MKYQISKLEVSLIALAFIAKAIFAGYYFSLDSKAASFEYIVINSCLAYIALGVLREKFLTNTFSVKSNVKYVLPRSFFGVLLACIDLIAVHTGFKLIFFLSGGKEGTLRHVIPGGFIMVAICFLALYGWKYFQVKSDQ